jgi:LDH2 family malate/lactate/ureidoglycolate dehydrogenase
MAKIMLISKTFSFAIFEERKLFQMTRLIREKLLRAFVSRSMRAVGTCESHAESVARVLVAADMRGHTSHGVNRLSMYVEEVEAGLVSGDAEPIVERSEKEAAILVNGNNAPGTVVGEFSMREAICRAKKFGVCVVSARQSNHYGIAGHYAMMAARQGLIGVSMTNTSPIVYPTRCASSVLGTNPIAIACPADKRADESAAALHPDSFVLDMATSTVAVGKVEVAHRTHRLLPDGWGADADGKPTNEPSRVLDGGGLTYLGGAEETGGYKGYGLGAAVDILCGVLSGSRYANQLPLWRATRDGPTDTGQFFMAIDAEAINPLFSKRLVDWSALIRSLPAVRPESPVLIAGDPERNAERRQSEHIELHDEIAVALDQLASTLSIDAPQWQNENGA